MEDCLTRLWLSFDPQNRHAGLQMPMCTRCKLGQFTLYHYMRVFTTFTDHDVRLKTPWHCAVDLN